MDKQQIKKSQKLTFVVILAIVSAVAALLTPAINKFNAGEVSPLMLARNDFVKYQNSCKTLQNMIVLSQGPATRRPGTKFITSTKSNAVARLLRFEFSKTDAYILEFGNLYTRFFRDGGQIQTNIGTEDLSALDNIVGHWKLNDDRNTDAVIDADGATHNLALNSGNSEDITVAGKVNAAFNLSGAFTAWKTKHVDFAFVEGTDGTFSVAAWVRVTDDSGSTNIVSAREDVAEAEWKLVLDADKKLQLRFSDQAFGETYKTSDAALQNGWNFVVSTYDGENGSWTGATAANFITLYVNGVAVDSTATNNALYTKMQSADADITIGALSASGPSFDGIWRDRIDNVALFSDVLTSSEISGLYSEGVYEIVTEYTTADLPGLQFVQSADIMWIVHPDHEPKELTRTGHTEWTLTDEDLETGPFLPQNTTDDTLTASATTGNVTITASAAPFLAGHVGSIWRMTGVVDNSAVSGTFSGTGSSTTLSLLKNQEFIFTTHGTWTGTVILQRSYDAGVTWQDVLTRHYEDDGNLDFSREERVDDALYRVTMDSYTSGALDYNFEALTVELDGVFEITAFTSTNSVTATVLSTLGSTGATTEWAEGYFSDVNGWPQTVVLHEERLVYGGNNFYPQTVWMSQTGDYVNFTEGTLPADAITYSLPGQNPIQWMASQDFLFIGTLGGAGRLGGNSPHDAISAEELPTYRQQSYTGSANIQAQIANDQILFIERGQRKVREVAFSLESDKYVSPDLTLLSEHITESGVNEIAYQERPESILWCVTDDGVLLSMTYKREQDVIAWARHVTDGTVESVAVIPGDEEDEVWLIVNRTIETATKRYIEQLQVMDWGSDQADMWFVDSALAFDGGDAVVITDITQADPAVVTMSAYPVDGDGDSLVDGDQIILTDVAGMTEVNDRVYTISNPNVTNKTVELRDSTDITDIDSTGFTAYTSAGTAQRVENTFAGLDHLEGETVSSLADGGTIDDEVVTGGAITIDMWANKVVSGLPYTSILETMPIVFGGQTGSSAARIKAIRSVTFDFYETLGTEYGPDGDNLREINFQTTETLLSGPIPLFTGFKKKTFQHGYEKQSTVYIQQDKPLPVTIRSIVPDIEVFN